MSRYLWSLIASIQMTLDSLSMHWVKFGRLGTQIPSRLSLCQNPLEHSDDKEECPSIPSTSFQRRSLGIGATALGCPSPRSFKSGTKMRHLRYKTRRFVSSGQNGHFRPKALFASHLRQHLGIHSHPKFLTPLDTRLTDAGMWASMNTSVHARHRQAPPRI